MTRLKLSRETLRQLNEDETPRVAGAGPTVGMTCGCTFYQCPPRSKRILACLDLTAVCEFATAHC